MRREIWKYPITPGIANELIPEGGVFLSLQLQQGRPRMWFLVDPDKIKVPRRFAVRSTGVPWDFDPREQYLGTFQPQESLDLVFHVFEVPL